MEKIGIIGHGLMNTTLAMTFARAMAEQQIVVVSHPIPEPINQVNIKPFELAELPRPFVDDRPLLSKYRKGHSSPIMSATQQRKARQRKNKIQANSRRKNHK